MWVNTAALGHKEFRVKITANPVVRFEVKVIAQPQNLYGFPYQLPLTIKYLALKGGTLNPFGMNKLHIPCYLGRAAAFTFLRRQKGVSHHKVP